MNPNEDIAWISEHAGVDKGEVIARALHFTRVCMTHEFEGGLVYQDLSDALFTKVEIEGEDDIDEKIAKRVAEIASDHDLHQKNRCTANTYCHGVGSSYRCEICKIGYHLEKSE